MPFIVFILIYLYLIAHLSYMFMNKVDFSLFRPSSESRAPLITKERVEADLKRIQATRAAMAGKTIKESISDHLETKKNFLNENRMPIEGSNSLVRLDKIIWSWQRTMLFVNTEGWNVRFRISMKSWGKLNVKISSNTREPTTAEYKAAIKMGYAVFNKPVKKSSKDITK